MAASSNVLIPVRSVGLEPGYSEGHPLHYSGKQENGGLDVFQWLNVTVYVYRQIF
jgi:hypothetical protein